MFYTALYIYYHTRETRNVVHDVVYISTIHVWHVIFYTVLYIYIYYHTRATRNDLTCPPQRKMLFSLCGRQSVLHNIPSITHTAVDTVLTGKKRRLKNKKIDAHRVGIDKQTIYEAVDVKRVLSCYFFDFSFLTYSCTISNSESYGVCCTSLWQML